MKQGTPKFDGLTIGELSANFMQGPGIVALKAKVAFVNTKTGATHGWTTHDHWSPNVIAKLRELAELMEEEVAKVQFSGGEERAPTHSVASSAGGIGELFSSDDGAPQF